MGRFSVALDWEVEDGVEVALVVKGVFLRGKGNKTGTPDSWTPAWVELDVLEVENERGCPLPAPVVGRLCADKRFLRAVEQEVNAD